MVILLVELSDETFVVGVLIAFWFLLSLLHRQPIIFQINTSISRAINHALTTFGDS